MADKVKDAIDQGADTAKAATDAAARQGKENADRFREQVADPARQAGEAMKESGQRMAAGGASIGTRMIDQAEANTRAAFEAMRRAAEAKDLSDVMKVQGEFLREQGTRGMEQAREIGEMIMQFGRDAVTPLGGRRER